jgi:hypothetical protein
VTTTASLTIAAQTVGKKNNGTTLQSSVALVELSADGVQNDTYLRKNESASTSNLSNMHKQNFGVTLPTALLLDPFGIAVSIHDDLGAICATCLPYHTELTIPAASDVAQAGNPFYSDPDVGDTVFNPYGWKMSARYASNSTPDNVIHVDDDNIEHVVPACSAIGGAPTVADPLCWDSFVTGLSAPGNEKRADTTGRGLENGKIGFG